MVMLSPEQCRAARAWLNWSQEDLAKRASVGLSTVRSFEKGERIPIANNLAALVNAIQAAGIKPVSANDGRPMGITATLQEP